ncbi:MAG TPA: hypothetical protein VEB60_02055 [Candidatus Paceibacterota bacterium]|nr:hypothetical protein [Candidatus Paceibacterota bacterium]
MNKKEALIVLIRHSFLLPEETKAGLLAEVDAMAPEDVEALGLLLTKEKKDALAANTLELEEIDALVAKIQQKP